MKKSTIIGILGGTAALVAGGALLLPSLFAATPLVRTEPDAGAGLEATASIVKNLKDRRAIIDAVYFDRTLRESLPNQRFSVDGGAPEPSSARVVEGTVVDVSPGAAYSDTEETGSRQIPFDSPGASWRAIVLTVDVIEDFGQDRHAEAQLRVGLSVGADIDTRQALRAFKNAHVLLVLDEPGFYPFDRSLYSVAHSGALFGIVDANGSIAFPVIGDEEAEAYLDGVTSVDQITAEANEKREVIRYEKYERVAG